MVTNLKISRKFDGIAEDSTPPVATKIWGSVRLSYTIFAFVAMVLHVCMRNTISFAILCMVKPTSLQTLDAMAVKSQGHATLDACSAVYQNISQKSSDTAEFYWNRSQQLTLLGSFYYGYLFSLPIGGRLCDKFGGKLLFIYSIILQALVFIATPFFARISYEAITVARVIQGLIAGLGNPAIYQLYSVWGHPVERTALMSFAYGGVPVGSLLIYPITSYLCHFGWSTTFYCIGGIALLYGICCHWLIYSTLEGHPRLAEDEYKYLKSSQQNQKKPVIPWKSILTSIPVGAFLITHVCHSLGLIMLMLLTPTFLREAIGFTLDETGIFSSAPFAGSCLSKGITVASCTVIQKKFVANLTVFRRIIYVTCNLCTILLLVGIILLDCKQKALIVLLIMFIGITSDIAFSGAYWVSLLDCAPAFAGLLSGISNSMATLSGSLAPWLVSKIVLIGLKSEWNLVFLLLISANLIAATVYGAAGSSTLQPWANLEQKNVNDNKQNKEKQETYTAFEYY